MTVSGYGEFKRVGKYIFRTSAYLKFGQSDKDMGLIVMLNPGSSRLKNLSKWTQFQNSTESEITGELFLDPTMEIIVKIISKAIPTASGKLHIHNLFTLRNSKDEDALAIYDEIINDNTYNDIIHTNFGDVFKVEFPWIWLAWSVADTKSINNRKREVKYLIDKYCDNIHKFVLYSTNKKKQRDRIHILHPNPKNSKAKEKYKNDMISLIKSSI